MKFLRFATGLIVLSVFSISCDEQKEGPETIDPRDEVDGGPCSYTMDTTFLRITEVLSYPTDTGDPTEQVYDILVADINKPEIVMVGGDVFAEDFQYAEESSFYGQGGKCIKKIEWQIENGSCNPHMITADFKVVDCPCEMKYDTAVVKIDKVSYQPKDTTDASPLVNALHFVPLSNGRNSERPDDYPWIDDAIDYEVLREFNPETYQEGQLFRFIKAEPKKGDCSGFVVPLYQPLSEN